MQDKETIFHAYIAETRDGDEIHPVDLFTPEWIRENVPNVTKVTEARGMWTRWTMPGYLDCGDWETIRVGKQQEV